jgi:hypothetical protein
MVAGTIAGVSAGLLFEPGVAFASQRSERTRNPYYGYLPDEAKRNPVYYLTRSQFTPRLGDQFSVITDDAQSVSLNLYRINDLQNHSDSAAREVLRENELSFSLIFVGPLDQPLKQGISTFKHRAFDSFSVLMVPVGSDDNVRYYEVVFNRMYP